MYVCAGKLVQLAEAVCISGWVETRGLFTVVRDWSVPTGPVKCMYNGLLWKEETAYDND